MGLKAAVVTNEAQSPEFIHEKIDLGANCADHLRQQLLGNFGADLLRFGFPAVAREQQKSPRQRPRFAYSFRADLATRGFAISFWTPASVAWRDPFKSFFLGMYTGCQGDGSHSIQFGTVKG